MNILNKLTIRNLKLNRTRTLVAMFGIILATSLITVTIGLFSSFYSTLIRHVEADTGAYHVEYYDLTEEQKKELLKDKEVANYYSTNVIGYSISNLESEDAQFLQIVEYDKNAFKGNKITLLEGELPKNSNEIVIQKKMARYGFDKKVGDEITLEVFDESMYLSYLTEYNKRKVEKYNDENDNEEEIDEEIEDIDISGLITSMPNEKKYRIVGIIANLGYEIENPQSISFITYNDKIESTSSLFVAYKHPAKTINTVCKFITSNATEKNNCINNQLNTFNNSKGIQYGYNDTLLNYYGVGISSKTRTKILVIAACILAIISFSSIIIIKNSFSISVNERYKQYGMFSSVGATKKQLKRNVLFEGLIEGIISIPFGILLGCLIVIGLVTVTNNIFINDSLLSGGYEQLLYFKFPLICILIIALVSGITVYLSCIIPAIKISKVSPIDAIRNSGEIKLKKKKLKTSKIIKALFGIGGVLADKNIKRNRKKYRTIVISLTVSVIMFVVISACINILKKEMKKMDSSINYNYIYVAYDNSKHGRSEYTKEKREKFEKKTIEIFEEKINKFKLEKYAYGYFSSDANISEPIRISSDYFNDDYFVTYLETTREEYNKNNSDKLVPIDVVAVSDEEFKRISNRYKITQEEKETKALIYSKYRNDILSKKGNDALKDNNITSLSVNYKISEEETKNLDIEIIGEADLEEALLNEYERPVLIVSFDYKNKHEELFNYFEISGLYIYDSDNNKIVDNFENRTGNIETMLVDISSEMKSLENIILIMSIFMYTFIIIITLISITNIFNTISTSTMLRKKEFAILRSMGMSDKEFNRMIVLESILYSIKALIYGLIISIILLYMVYASENQGTFSSNLLFLFKNLPYISIIYSIAITVIVILSTMLYSLSKINKQNIIETIRSDNI